MGESFVLGHVTVEVLSDGTFRLDGGAMFGVVPKPLWSRVAPPDEKNRIQLGLNVLLVRTGDEVIVVDTGAGHHWSEKERGIYAIDNEPGLVQALASRGVSPESVTRVINTHLHFDHAGGNTRREGDAIVPTFPNAVYHVQAGELDWALSPTLRDRASYVPDTFVPLADAGRFETLDGDAEVVPGVRVVRTPGHTRNLQGILVGGGTQTLYFPSDLVPTAAHVSYPWIMGYDLEPLVTLENKQRMLPEATAGEWVVVLQHEPGPPAGRIVMEDGRPRFER